MPARWWKSPSRRAAYWWRDIYQFVTRGNFEQGALAALMIVAVGILPIMRIVRYADFAQVARDRLP